MEATPTWASGPRNVHALFNDRINSNGRSDDREGSFSEGPFEEGSDDDEEEEEEEEEGPLGLSPIAPTAMLSLVVVVAVVVVVWWLFAVVVDVIPFVPDPGAPTRVGLFGLVGVELFVTGLE